MMNKSKLALIAALAAVSIASPAFAQSFERTGSVLPHYYDASGVLVWGAWGPPQAPAIINHRVARSTRDLPMSARSGASAFAAVPLTTRSDPIQTVEHSQAAAASATIKTSTTTRSQESRAGVSSPVIQAASTEQSPVHRVKTPHEGQAAALACSVRLTPSCLI
jgi:hypothetical protein